MQDVYRRKLASILGYGATSFGWSLEVFDGPVAVPPATIHCQ